MAHVTPDRWQTVEEEYGKPQVFTWTYPITEPEMQMVVSSTRGQTRLHDVTLFIRNPQGEIALIRKHGYPPGAWRAPGGGIHPGEDFIVGALREAHEETGLNARVSRYLLRIHITFTCGEQVQPWTTHVLDADTLDTTPTICDPKEISAVRFGTLQELTHEVADALRTSGRGLFQYRRALHAVAAALLDPRAGNSSI